MHSYLHKEVALSFLCVFCTTSKTSSNTLVSDTKKRDRSGLSRKRGPSSVWILLTCRADEVGKWPNGRQEASERAIISLKELRVDPLRSSTRSDTLNCQKQQKQLYSFKTYL